MTRSFVTIFCCTFFVTLAACDRNHATRWQGYAEGDYVYIAAPRSGRLLELAVRKGEEIVSGVPLFRLDPEPEATAVNEARQRMEQAGFRASDIRRGERPSELAALAAKRAQVRTARDLAQAELVRREQLFNDSVISREQLDQARALFEQQRAAVSELDSRLVTARLGGRRDQQQAVSAEAAAAQEALRAAEWNLGQKRQSAPVAGLVFDTLYEVGELVPANSPVVILLPPQGRKARFYVPEPQLTRIHPGSKVRLRFGDVELGATVSYVSPEAEYTPPVIYSRETRDKLVYLVEARPDPADAVRLKPGQPLEVVPE